MLEILKYILPSLVLGGIFFYLLKKQPEKQKTEQEKLPAKENGIDFIKLKLQAYERLTLLLERIKANSILLRLDKAEFTTEDLHRELLKSIRDEFDHNITQQIYMSDEAWNKVNYAKENLLNTINSAAIESSGKGKKVFTATIIDRIASQKEDPISNALKQIKKDVQLLNR